MTDSKLKTRRTDSVRIKLSPDMLSRLEAQSESFGMPIATVCAFAVADWILRRENEKSLLRMASLEMARFLGEMFSLSSEQVEQSLSSRFPDLFKETGSAPKETGSAPESTAESAPIT
jgi:hypothetical protein